MVNAAEAARIIECPENHMRFYLDKGIWKFGQVVPKSVTGKKIKKYLVNVRAMCKYFGIPLEEAERRLSKNGST